MEHRARSLKHCRTQETAEAGWVGKWQRPGRPLDSESQQSLKHSLELSARKEVIDRELFINSFYSKSLFHMTSRFLFRELVIPAYILIRYGFRLKSLITFFRVLTI